MLKLLYTIFEVFQKEGPPPAMSIPNNQMEKGQFTSAKVREYLVAWN
jgi:hypothetical protein